MPRSRLLTRLQRNLRAPFRPSAKRLQRELNSQLSGNFDRQAGPDGAPWKPLTPEYARRKRGPQILVETGRLKRSLTVPNDPEGIFEVGRRDVVFGTSVPYSYYANREREYFYVDTEKIAEVVQEGLVGRR